MFFFLFILLKIFSFYPKTFRRICLKNSEEFFIIFMIIELQNSSLTVCKKIDMNLGYVVHVLRIKTHIQELNQT